MRRRHVIYATLLTTLAGCATGGGAGGYVEPTSHAGRTSDVISSAEMRDAGPGVTNAFQAIARLRPSFLYRVREMSAVQPNVSLLEVYLNDAKLGGLETLQTIPIESIKTIQYLSSSEATMRWGTNHTGGVILLSTH